MNSQILTLEPGQISEIVSLEGSKAEISRLRNMGFTAGASITIIRNDIGKVHGNTINTLKGPLLVRIRGGNIALGYKEAKCIFVKLPGSSNSTNTKEATTNTSNVTSTTTVQSDNFSVTWSKNHIPKKTANRHFTLALAGQPNVGKSTLFNHLTGGKQHVGNWPGKTIQKKVGVLQFRGKQIEVVDLPGATALSSHSEEELIVREYVIESPPDLVAVVVDASNMERSLYLAAEILLLPVPVILILNMIDVAEKEGLKIEAQVLEKAIGLPVLPMCATRGKGLELLLSIIDKMASSNYNYNPRIPEVLPSHQSILSTIHSMVCNFVPEKYSSWWVSLKLLEGDENITILIQKLLPQDIWIKVEALIYQHEDAVLDIVGGRYKWIGRMVRAAIVDPPSSKINLTTKLDRFLIHPVFGSLFLVVCLGAVFLLTYTIGAPIQLLLSNMLQTLSQHIMGFSHTSSPFIATLLNLLSGGIIGGVGMVLTFIPILAIFYFALGVLEDTGYMARAAYLTDRFMHTLGLHGKSFMPMVLGFGCNVPAVLGTRIIESKPARLLTILLIPFIPCTARMVVVSVLAPIFFGPAAFWVTWALVGGNILIMAAVGLLLHRSAMGDKHIPFIMELPLYHRPNIKTIGVYIWQNLVSFLKRAATVILVGAVIIWSLSYFPTGELSTSFLGILGNFLQPLGQLLGLPWQVFVAILTSLAVKENTISTLGILYGDLAANLPAVLSWTSALGLLVFQMLFIPCIATIASIKQETGSIKWTLLSIFSMLFISLIFGIGIYQLVRVL